MKLRFLLAAFLLVFGCSKQKVYDELDRAVSYFTIQPDSTLKILSGIDMNLIISKKQKARYYLYLSAALDKNYIDVRSDSLIDRALSYYQTHGEDRDRMLCFYYKGIVNMNQKNFTSAVKYYEKAASLADKLEDNHQLGMIYKNIGSAFSQSNNLYSSENYYRRSLNAFLLVPKDSVYQQYARYSLASVYVSRKEYEQARGQLTAINPGSDTYLDYHCKMLLAEIALSYDKDPLTCILTYRSVPIDYYYHSDYMNVALAHERLMQRDSADYWIKSAYKRWPGVLPSAVIDYTKSRIIRGRERSNISYDLLKNASHVQDSLTRILLGESISCAQRDFFREDAENQRMIGVHRRRLIYAVVIISILLITIIVLLFSIRWTKKEAQTKELMGQLAIKNKSINRLSKDNASLVMNHYSERIRQMDTISTQYYLADSETRKNLVFKQFKEYIGELDKNDTFYNSLEEDLNRYCNDIMSKLRLEVPEIRGRNLRIIALFFAGFSYETVAIITNALSINSLKTCRSRLRKSIIASGATDTEFFLEMLDMKRQSADKTNE